MLLSLRKPELWEWEDTLNSLDSEVLMYIDFLMPENVTILMSENHRKIIGSSRNII